MMAKLPPIEGLKKLEAGPEGIRLAEEGLGPNTMDIGND